MDPAVDFSANAPIYDRRHGAVLSPEAARKLAQLAGLQPGGRILDVGASTGRVALAFADLACEVVALDASPAMLGELRRKAGSTRVHLVAAEAGRFPFKPRSFDAAILARVLYLLPDWNMALRRIC